MAAPWNKKGRKKKRNKKLSPEQCRKISLGRLNSAKIKTQKEATKKRRELKRQIQRQQRLQQIAIWGSYFSPETRAKLSQLRKGSIPWNKGIKAWNDGMKWPIEVKENISRGMIAYWILKKEGREKQNTNSLATNSISCVLS